MLKHYSLRDFVIQLLLATFITLAVGLAVSVHAQETSYDASFNSASKESIPINVLVGQSRVLNFDRSIGRFSISNPEVAEAVMVSPTQVLVNVAMVVGLIPVVGIPLPFMSYGGSSMVVSMMALGLLLSVRMRQFQ